MGARGSRPAPRGRVVGPLQAGSDRSRGRTPVIRDDADEIKARLNDRLEQVLDRFWSGWKKRGKIAYCAPVNDGDLGSFQVYLGRVNAKYDRGVWVRSSAGIGGDELNLYAYGFTGSHRPPQRFSAPPANLSASTTPGRKLRRRLAAARIWRLTERQSGRRTSVVRSSTRPSVSAMRWCFGVRSRR